MSQADTFTGTSRANCLSVVLNLLGGLHYGYNLAITGSVLPELKRDLAVTDTTSLGILASATVFGAIVGSPLSGPIAETYGRRVATVIGETLSVAGALGCAISSKTMIMIGWRLLIGLGVGFCTVCKPIYVSEISSADYRATILATFSPAIAFGILLAQVAETVAVSWRLKLMLGSLLPGLLLLVALLVMPESPVWLQSMRASSSRRSSSQLCNFGEATSSAKSFQVDGSVAASRHGEHGPEQQQHAPDRAVEHGRQRMFSAFWHAMMGSASGRRAALLAFCLGACHQGTGDYVILVYASSILKPFDVGVALASAGPVVVSAANLIGSIVGVLIIEKFGRRTLLMGGLTALGASLVGMSLVALFARPTLYITMLILITFFAFVFQIGPGCIYFVVITEVSAPQLKTYTYALGNLCRYGFELLAGVSYFSLSEAIGTPGLLGIYAAVAFGCFECIRRCLVEVRVVQGTTVRYDLSGTWCTTKNMQASDNSATLH